VRLSGRLVVRRPVELGPHASGADGWILCHLDRSGPPQVQAGGRVEFGGSGSLRGLGRRPLPAGALLIPGERAVSPVQAAIPEPDGDALAEVAAARARGR
jgi:hypothetical protein